MLQKIPSWKLMSKGEREHIKAYHIRENAHLKLLLMLLINKRRDVSCLQEGKDMIVYVMTLSALVIFLFALIFCYPIYSHYPMSDSGGERHLREENLWNSLHIFILGDMSKSK